MACTLGRLHIKANIEPLERTTGQQPPQVFKRTHRLQVFCPQCGALYQLTAPQAGPEDVLAADAYVFATPENLAAIAGLMKDFFDRCYYPVLGRIEGRPYATLICAGSDGSNAARQVERICTGWRLKAAAPALIVCTHAQTPEDILAPKQIPADELKRADELGAALAAGVAMGVF